MQVCTKHQTPMVRLGSGMECLACLAEVSAPARQRAIEFQSAVQAEKVRKRSREAAIPVGFQQCSFANFDASTPRAQQIAAAMSNYADNFATQRSIRTGFVFIGVPGNGKTHMACAMAQAIINRGFSAAYASLPRFTRELRSTYGRRGASDALTDRLIEADFLVLDEIDLHGSSDSDYNLLYDIVNARYESNSRPILAISNRSLDHLINDLDERVISRILGATKPIVFDWPSKRGASDWRAAAHHKTENDSRGARS
ncbi:hypothetical protein CBP36_19810 (plasmid) [Acidovorax carolinensis]|uniref:IstB-like ATP-binding domain-containing protein n=2 Tax=Acidovorax carolinensis TaxID=553814 RepID=A0A240UI81_9BURK|nr:ATP-binding protein [Acidovorax carolinensis]ART57155.1 hypothetical protein CBP35_19775 [Acidovorax carolinensis]ART61214.1 hypothetical protein CBP36_19810 [Acidovorax carolinensis]